ncbi:serine hydrolase domain-containing protein [Limobrevibacterium gyesilva]|uniref:Serine hydrolase n=1 Tax=Limobrevibacterium gyesilva TaxID=2991712 RepID=A0AA42CE90_9PROT|nr:serine hydrolase [Limobrevibacterium gyesilva]MCW3474979.1 serine hydrolase [Limobrevibacterium gyesilva]
MTDRYVPPPHGQDWQRITPAEAGFDSARLAEAIAFAEAHESPWRRDIKAQLEAGNFEPPPDNAIIGPTAPRGGPNGLLLRGGRLVARWGDTRQVDMTFSVAKSYLSILAGLAVSDGLIADLDEPVGRTVHDGGFDGPHNGAITWRHLLQQTSEWEGTLFGKADMIDRYRTLATEFRGSPAHQKGTARPLQAPGSYWEYNDVRVNRLSLALLRRFGRALPDVFAERVMQPLGASTEWHWEGYHNSFVEIGGRQVQSVSGGGHWGGGVFIHAEDQARIGLMMAQGGSWGGRRILPQSWIAESVAPCAINPDYGLLWWLNTGRRSRPSAGADSYFALGAGGNVTWIDPANDLVAVLRWIDTAVLDAWIGQVMAALKAEVPAG